MTAAGPAPDTPEADLELLRPEGTLRPAWLAGWRERIDLPRLGAYRLVAKLDTGARTSALHAREIKRDVDGSGRTWLTIELLAPDEDSGADRRGDTGALGGSGAPGGSGVPGDSGLVVPPGPVRARWVADRLIRSSNGAEELRAVIRTTVALGGHRWPCEMTLAERGSMGHPVLLGRTAIRRRFLVHPGRSFLADAPSIVAAPGEA